MKTTCFKCKALVCVLSWVIQNNCTEVQSCYSETYIKQQSIISGHPVISKWL